MKNSLRNGGQSFSETPVIVVKHLIPVSGILLIVLFAVFTSCKKYHTLSLPDVLSSRNLLPLLLDTGITTDFQLYAKETVIDMYAIYDHELLWCKENRVSKKGRELVAFINQCETYGLYPADFHENEICSFNLDSLDEFESAKLDILLTDSYFYLAHQLQHGTLDRKTLQAHNLQVTDTLLLISLHKALRSSTLLEQLSTHEPDHYFYRRFKTSLKRLLDQRDSCRDYSELDDDILNLNVNLERWRWEYNIFPERYIFINIPSYQLYLFENDEIVMQSRVIVGRPDHPTPVLNSVIECFVIYPYWHVPHSIAVNELLPEFKKDPSRVAKQHFDVLQDGKIQDASAIDWKKYNARNFPFLLRQREGIDNALGVVKFVFDNPYGVYLHDTNARQLFSATDRDLSHGCIRMEMARDLAFYLVRNHSPSVQDDLEKLFKSKTRKEITLQEPIPIFVRYYTHDEGKRYADVYQQHEKLMRAVTNPVFSFAIPESLTAPASPASAGQ